MFVIKQMFSSGTFDIYQFNDLSLFLGKCVLAVCYEINYEANFNKLRLKTEMYSYAEGRVSSGGRRNLSHLGSKVPL